MANEKTLPSEENILELYDSVKAKYDATDLWKKFEEDEQFYELEFKTMLNLPEKFADEGIVLPTARDIVDTCVDHTDIYNLKVGANRKGTSMRSEEEAEILRKFGLGIVHRNNVEAQIAPVREVAKHFWLHGIGVFKTTWDADRMIDLPSQKEGESDEDYALRVEEARGDMVDSAPIVISCVHPRNIMQDVFSQGTPQFIFETQIELVSQAKLAYPEWDGGGKKGAEEVEHISYWTNKVRAEFYDRKMVKCVFHDYGFLPYVIIETGLGNRNMKNEMSKRYVGVLRYIQDLLISESRDYSMGDIILKKNVWPWGYAKGPNAAAAAKIETGFGDYNPLPAGVDELVDVVPKMPPDALLTWLTMSTGAISAHAAPNVVRGMSETGVRSAADRQQILAQAVTRYVYSAEAFRNGTAKMLSNCARIQKNVIKGNVRVWARTPSDEFDITIDVDKMHEPFTFWVEYGPVSPEDEYRKHDDLERQVQHGLITVYEARKQMSNIDPKAMDIDMEYEKLKDSPGIRQALDMFGSQLLNVMLQRKLAELGVMPTAPPPAEAATGEQGEGAPPAEEGVGTRRTAPQVPNMAPKGSAQDLQNQMKKQRSQVNVTEQGRGGGGNNG